MLVKTQKSRFLRHQLNSALQFQLTTAVVRYKKKQKKQQAKKLHKCQSEIKAVKTPWHITDTIQ